MPKLTLEEVQELVDRGKLTAITVDTSEIHHFGYNLKAKSLSALGQFKGTNIAVPLSEVVLAEVHAHMTARMSDAAEKVCTGISLFLKEWRIGRDRDAVHTGLGLGDDAAARARTLLDAFVAEIGAERVSVDNGVNVRDLHERYVASRPPFSTKADKKNEFPDAIALLSLEEWARQRGRMLLAVSADGDWARFAEGSDQIVCLPQIAPALNLFHREDSVFAARVANLLRADAAPALSAAIEGQLERLIETFDVEASAPYFYEEEAGLSRVVSWKLKDDAKLDVVASDEDSASLAFTVILEAEFEAYFSFSMKDGIDRDYVTIGSSHASRIESFEVPLVATIPKDEDDDPTPFEVEADGWGVSVDFGYVEPEFERD